MLSTGSSVTTQVCTTVAATRPDTRNPSAPCRVRSKPASSRGSAARSAALAMALRASARRRRDRHAARSPECRRRRPARSRHGRLFRGFVWFNCGVTASGSGKSSSARGQRGHRLRVQPAARLPHIGSQALRAPSGGADDAEYIAGDAPPRAPAYHWPARRSRRLGAAIKGLGHLPHLLGHRQVADAHFAEIGVDVAAEAVEQSCPAAGMMSVPLGWSCPNRRISSTRCSTSCRAGPPPCQARRNRDRTPGIAPAPRSCHRARRCCGAPRAAEGERNHRVRGFPAAAALSCPLLFRGTSGNPAEALDASKMTVKTAD